MILRIKSTLTTEFGNRSDHFTSHYLVKVIDNIVEHAGKSKRLSRIVITDFPKAFDRVDHNFAIPKRIQMDARPSIITWISSFLSQRSQSVRYQDVLSSYSFQVVYPRSSYVCCSGNDVNCAQYGCEQNDAQVC